MFLRLWKAVGREGVLVPRWHSNKRINKSIFLTPLHFDLKGVSESANYVLYAKVTFVRTIDFIYLFCLSTYKKENEWVEMRLQWEFKKVESSYILIASEFYPGWQGSMEGFFYRCEFYLKQERIWALKALKWARKSQIVRYRGNVLILIKVEQVHLCCPKAFHASSRFKPKNISRKLLSSSFDIRQHVVFISAAAWSGKQGWGNEAEV